MELPRARDKNYGLEYCGAIYSFGDGTYYASKPSPLTEPTLNYQSTKKSCGAPREVKDARSMGLPPPIIADYHSHPWAPSEMSEQDRKGKNHLWSIRIQFDTACHIQKLIPYAYDNRPGELYERRGKTWKLIAIIQIEDKDTGKLSRVSE
jgi:proteasome lid subunit RPN8/RPN11